MEKLEEHIDEELARKQYRKYGYFCFALSFVFLYLFGIKDVIVYHSGEPVKAVVVDNETRYHSRKYGRESKYQASIVEFNGERRDADRFLGKIGETVEVKHKEGFSEVVPADMSESAYNSMLITPFVGCLFPFLLGIMMLTGCMQKLQNFLKGNS